MRRWVLLAVGLGTGCAAEHPRPPAPFLPEVYIEYRADNREAILERRYRNMDWIPVCASPCSRTVRPDFEYRVGGEWIVPSKPFVLYQPTTIDVRAGSRSTRAFGIVAVSVGIPMMFIGGILTMIGLSAEGSSDRGGYGGPSWQGAATVFGLGIASTVGGAIAVGTNDTRVEFRERSPLAKLTLKF